MSTTITVNGTASTIAPVLVLGYETDRNSRNIVHDLIGGGVAVTLIAPNPRSGRLSLFFTTEALAKSALDLHATETTFTLTSTDRTTIGMTYVVDSQVTLRLDEATLNLWVVEVGYQEIVL